MTDMLMKRMTDIFIKGGNLDPEIDMHGGKMI